MGKHNFEKIKGKPMTHRRQRQRTQMDTHDVRLDEVGAWTEIKLGVIRDYVAPYSAILKKKAVIRQFAYIDGFAGAGQHISKTTGDVIPGSPVIALEYGFDRYHFVDWIAPGLTEASYPGR